MPGRSVIFSIDFEVTLRMGADGADFRRFRADNNVSAVTAFPDFDTAFFEYTKECVFSDIRWLIILTVAQIILTYLLLFWHVHKKE